MNMMIRDRDRLTPAMAHEAARKAEAVWDRELVRAFGRSAVVARYATQGIGTEGSALNKAYKAHRAASETFNAVSVAAGGRPSL